MSSDLRCPVCNARLRAQPDCGRCGADLTEWQRLLAAAWRERRDGWRRLAEHPIAAAGAAARSNALAASPSAARLAWLAAILQRYFRPRDQPPAI